MNAYRSRSRGGNKMYIYIFIHHYICMLYIIYYPPEMRREYWELGVILLQYFPLVKICKLMHYNCINMNMHIGKKS